jgi:hypothetical protein
MKRWFVAAAALFVMSGWARAEEDAEIRAAQRDLQSAKSHLQAATHDYGGHRKQALERVNNALDDVREALAVSAREERKDDKKDQRLEHKQQKLEHQVDDIEKQQQKLKNK